jgi:hypothetical protein
MGKIFGFSVKRTVEDDEFAVKPKQARPTLVTEQTFFIKRAGDQVFVTITNEADNFFGVLLALVRLIRRKLQQSKPRTRLNGLSTSSRGNYRFAQSEMPVPISCRR